MLHTPISALPDARGEPRYEARVSMASTVIERTAELRGLVTSLAQLRDGIGVLSITIGIALGAVSGGTPSWEIALENDLNRLHHDSSVRSPSNGDWNRSLRVSRSCSRRPGRGEGVLSTLRSSRVP
jgi:hypothetical protein